MFSSAKFKAEEKEKELGLSLTVFLYQDLTCVLGSYDFYCF